MIDQSTLNGIVDSMPERVAAMVNARGGHIKW